MVIQTATHLNQYLDKACDEDRLHNRVVMQHGFTIALAQSKFGSPPSDDVIEKFLDDELAPIKTKVVLATAKSNLKHACKLAHTKYKSVKLLVADAQDEALVAKCLKKTGFENRTRFIIFENSKQSSPPNTQTQAATLDENGQIRGALHVSKNLSNDELCKHLDRVLKSYPKPQTALYKVM